MSTEKHEPDVDVKDRDRDSTSQAGDASQFDFASYYDHNAGRLVVDPDTEHQSTYSEAKREFGDAVASRLKLSADGSKVLWPQPLDDPEDPQNWSDFRKNFQLLIITLAAITPDFDSGIGIADIFALANQFNTTTGHINNLTSKNQTPQAASQLEHLPARYLYHSFLIGVEKP
ncbi:hypothetical protein GSI_01880 [Ganoderma sinense ZZ0214-1]|uniref:Uncharacterized protein n=1 Tax=Ganoderma sinense ZZ0214-1 TaxID=1077348 RepID=A0A2G8SR25_9APHY|nr:hypothetical protein GSI_01880 [Ganoderma sinense ZZ0214-1]